MELEIFQPALRSYTVVDYNSTTLFISCLNPSTESPQVWTNLPNGVWQAFEFEHHDSSLFVASLPLPATSDQDQTFEFTFRKVQEGGNVIWLGGEGSNGVVKVPATSSGETPSPGDDLACTLHQEFPIPPGGSPEQLSFPLASLLESLRLDLTIAEGLVLEQRETTWFVPRTIPAGTADPLSFVSPHLVTQLLILRLPSQQTLVLLPFSTDKIASSLYRDEHLGGLHLLCIRDASSGDGTTGNLVVGVGPDGTLQDIIEGCISIAGKAVLSTSLAPYLNGHSKSSPHIARSGITWCTWNALGPKYTLSEVLVSLQSLTCKPSEPTLFSEAIDEVLLDDGWQDTSIWEDTVDGQVKSRRGLWSFDVRKGWFDTGDVGSESHLRKGVKKIKETGIKRVGVWVTIVGYWDGIHPSSPLAYTYDVYPYRLESSIHPSADTTWHLPASVSTLDAFYNDYFSVLKNAGVDFIKIDDQAHVDYLVSSSSRADGALDSGSLRTAIFTSMRAAAHALFGVGNVTHCMTGSPRIWGSAQALLPPPPSFSGTRDILRNSDDYSPHEPDSHRYHIAFNALSNLYSRSLPGLRPCFDMCQESQYHLALRAFQPAPLLSTDTAGKSILSGGPWEKLLARSIEGDVKVLKIEGGAGAVLEGRIGEDVLAAGNGPSLKVAASVKSAQGALLGLWNCRGKQGLSSDVLDARDVVDALGTSRLPGADYVLILPPTSTQTSTSQLVTAEDLSRAEGAPRPLARPLRSIRLEPQEAVVGSVVPVFSLPGGMIACTGLEGKFAGMCALEKIEVVNRSRDRVLRSPPRSWDSLLARVLLGPRPPSTSSRPRTIASIAHDLLHHPISTIDRGTRGLFSWVLSGVAHTLSRLRDGNLKQSPESASAPELVLRVTLGLVGQLGVFVVKGDASKLEFVVDGKKAESVVQAADSGDFEYIVLESSANGVKGDSLVVDVGFA